jgi:uncharacterized membrane protein
MPKYPLLSAFIGIMQIFEAAFLLRDNGSFGAATIAFAGIELIWAIVSVVVLFKAQDRVIRGLAGVFVAYNMLGWIACLMMPQSGEHYTLPLTAIIVAGVFGIVYAMGSMVIAYRPRAA